MPITFANSEVEAYYEKGLAFEASKAWKEAAESYDLAAHAEPVHPEVWYRLGEALAQLEGCGCRGFDAALTCKATTANDFYWRAKSTAAKISWCYGHDDHNYDKVISANYAACVGLDPDNAEAWFGYGEVSSNEYELRLRCYDQALRLDPANTLYYYGRAQCHQRTGYFDKALADYNIIVALEPEKAEHYFNRGQLYQEYDHLEEAMADYSTSLAIRHSERTAQERGKLRILTHNFKGALDDFGLTKRTYYNWRFDIEIKIYFPAPGMQTADVRWEEAVRAMEQSGLIEATHPDYLKGLCEHYLIKYHEYCIQPEPEETSLALAAADALIASKPNQLSFRELRIACQFTQQAPDMAVLVLDYEWLLQHALVKAKKADRVNTKQGFYEAYLKQVEFQHKLAWAQYCLGNYTGALASFAAAVGSMLQDLYINNLNYYIDRQIFKAFLPPLPADDYILWQLRQQLQQNHTDTSTDRQVRSWLSVAIDTLSGQESQVLEPAFKQYQRTYLVAGNYFVEPRTAEQYTEALALCAQGAQKVPALADIFKQMSLNILKGQLREATNQVGATEVSKKAALAHYDTARAEMLAK